MNHQSQFADLRPGLPQIALVGSRTFLLVRIPKIQKPAARSKTGLMIHETFAAGSPHALAVVTPSNGILFQHLGATNGTSEDTTASGLAAPSLTTATLCTAIIDNLTINP
jgi:hypothetical protein